jgi:hypothetical protein
MSDDQAVIIRDWKGTRVLLPTKYGPVVATWTRAGHVHVSAGQGDEGTQLVYRSIEWHASVHLFKASGWTEEEPPGHSNFRHQFTAYTGGTRLREIPPTWRAAIVVEITTVVTAFTDAHPEIPAEADVDYYEAELARASRTEDEAHVALAEAQAQVAKLTPKLRRAREKHETLADIAAGRLIVTKIRN